MKVTLALERYERHIPFFLGQVKIPSGVDDANVRGELINDYRIEIGGGLGPLAGKIWRIGLMGETAKKESIQKLMDAFRKILN